MPTVVIDGIETAYEVVGSGPPLLMFSPGGFDATMAKWSTQGIYQEIRPLDHLPERHSCIVFDRRESGSSGGRVERLTWGHYAAQGKGLLDHLGIERADVMGACMGCPPVLALAVTHPNVVRSAVLYWPVGGARYRIRGQGRFGQHLAFALEHGLGEVVELAKRDGASFGEDPRVGPWASVLRRDPEFEEGYRSLDPDRYTLIVSATARTLFDRDSAPGPEPEELLALGIRALIVPGQDASHPTSAARFLQECLTGSDYWDAPVADQTEADAAARVLGFLDAVGDA